MFKFLKEKLGNWAKKLSEKEQEEPEKQDQGLANPIAEAKQKEKKQKKSKEKKTKDKEIKIPLKVDYPSISPDKEYLEKEIEKIEEEQEPEKSEGFFSKITSKFNKVKISEKDFEEYSEELENVLLENNVALEVADKIIQDLKKEIVGKEFLKKEIEFQIKESLKDVILKVLIEPYSIIDKIREKSEKPYVILFCGINGSGKTTTIAKIASFLKKKNISCVIAAGDTFRAASIEQLKKHGDKLKVEVIAHEYGSDPAAVGFDAIKYAKKNVIDCVLIDTAGRMHTAKNLLREMEKIVKVTKPDCKIFIGESITGNDSIEQVKSFDEVIGIDGIILSKADIDEKGGTALSLGYTTNKPILYLGTGQEYDKLEPFNKNNFIEKLGL